MTRDPARKITFVHTPEVYYEQNYGTRFIPLWAYTLAAHVPDHWDVSIVDCTIEDRETIGPAPIFAMSGINQDLAAIQSTHEYLKRKYPDATFLLGGPITWSFEQDGRLGELGAFDHLFILHGELALPRFLAQYEAGARSAIDPVIRGERFDLLQARPFHEELLGRHARRYYGGVVEVSRGCPFLCEFCDIRVLPQNNETHPKPVDLVVQELDAYYRQGVRQVQLACDNYIGNLTWAEECTDAIIRWTEETGAEMALYTWLTVNLSKLPRLMEKMRRAGFQSLFIGVESFHANSILETAKVQNKNDENQMTVALREIQSYGFMIAPGLIFGFDSDPETIFEETLEGVQQSGLVAGDPTFLLALPGTPLHARMKRANRLIEADGSEETVALHKERVSKVESNIVYLQPRDFLVEGFIGFIRDFTRPGYMYARFAEHVSILMNSDHFVASHAVGYGSLSEYLRFQLSSWRNFSRLCRRLGFALVPANLWAILRAYGLVLRHRGKYPGLKNHFSSWLFFWTNLMMKYQSLRPEDFIIHSVGEEYDLENVWRELDYRATGLRPNGRDGDDVKVGAQLKSTHEALVRLRRKIETAT